MALRKKTYKKKRYYKKRRYPLSKGQVKAVKKLVKKDEEVKYKIQQGDTTISNAGYVSSIGVWPSKGISHTQRIGDNIYVRSIWVDYSFAVADTYNLCRITIFQWYMNSTLTQPTIDSIYDTPGGYPVYAPFNKEFSSQYKVLYDKVHNLSSNGREVIHRRLRLTRGFMRNLKLTEDTPTYNCIHKGEIYAVMSSDSSAMSHPAFVWTTRINYTDA